MYYCDRLPEDNIEIISKANSDLFLIKLIHLIVFFNVTIMKSFCTFFKNKFSLKRKQDNKKSVANAFFLLKTRDQRKQISWLEKQIRERRILQENQLCNAYDSCIQSCMNNIKSYKITQ